MILFPTIELQNQRCVSLKRGRLEESSIWHVDPVQKAREFAEAGAEWMHVTDFNAIEGDQQNEALVERIIRAAGIPVQLAGGFRTVDRVERWIDKGAARIVMGTAAVKTPDMVNQLANLHPDQVVLAMDVWNGHVLTDGWREESMFTPNAFLDAYQNTPLAGVIYTDVHADVGDADASLSALAQIAEYSRIPIIASGLVRTADDLSRLKYAGHCHGTIIGRALFEKSISLAEALEIARPDAVKTAEFI